MRLAAAVVAALALASAAGADVTERSASNTTVSPDGTQIAWTDGLAGKIFVSRTDGSATRLYASAPTSEGISDMRWTRQGLLVDSNFTVYLVRPGRKPRVVIPGKYGGFEFATGGTRVATGLERAPGQYVITDVVTGKRWLYGSPKTPNHYGSLSPDGRKVAWTGRGGVLIARLGGTAHRLAAKAACPSWAPDGKSIAFLRFPSLRVIPATGGRSRLLVARAGGCQQAAWSPDSRTIAFAGAGGVILVDARTGKTRRLPRSLGETSYPAWAPDGTLYVSSQPAQDAGSNCLDVATAAGTVVVHGCP